MGFRCLTRVGFDTTEVYRNLKSAGCDLVCLGVESGSQYILDRMNKQITVAESIYAVKQAKEAGLRVRVFLVIGFPGETKETLDETKRFLENARPDEYLVSNFIPYPGSAVWNNPAKFGITEMKKDFSQYFQVAGEGYGGINISTDVLSAEDFSGLESGFRKWVKDFYKRGFAYGRVLQGT